MDQFMVVGTFRPDTDMGEVTALVPEEMAQVKVLEGEHVLRAVRVSLARDKVFLEVSAEDAAAAEATVHRLPMAKWWDLEIYEIHTPA